MASDFYGLYADAFFPGRKYDSVVVRRVVRGSQPIKQIDGLSFLLLGEVGITHRHFDVLMAQDLLQLFQV
jgi:hypothetical protein